MGLPESPAPEIYHAAGCGECRNTGYLGRSGVYELIAIDDTLSAMIHDKESEQKMRKYARSHFMSLRQDGYRRVLLGDTSLEEVLRVTGEG
jgi:general secretion pathway protein E